MSETHHSDHLRQTCRKCGSRMRVLGKSDPAPNGHHRTVFHCSECDERRLRG